MGGEFDERPSARVRLEVAYLDDATPPEPEPAINDESARLTIVVVAADADVRRYVGECLRGRASVKVYDVESVRAATELARRIPLDLAIVDGTDGVEGLGQLRAIVIVDEVPYGTTTATQLIRLLSRPFSAEQLCGALDLLVGSDR